MAVAALDLSIIQHRVCLCLMGHLHLHLRTVGVSTVSAFGADGDPPGLLQFYLVAQSCDQSCNA